MRTLLLILAALTCYITNAQDKLVLYKGGPSIDLEGRPDHYYPNCTGRQSINTVYFTRWAESTSSTPDPYDLHPNRIYTNQTYQDKYFSVVAEIYTIPGTQTCPDATTLNFSRRYYTEQHIVLQPNLYRAQVVRFDFLNISDLCTNTNKVDLRNLLTYYDENYVDITGVGVEGGYLFNPAAAGVGDHVITARGEFDNGSINRSITITVNPTYDDQAADQGEMWLVDAFNVCSDEQGINLADNVRFTGTGANDGFSWDQGTGNVFSPSIGEGTYEVNYRFTNGFGCRTNHPITVNVTDAFELSTTSLVEKCIDAQAFELTASPSGGEWINLDDPSSISEISGDYYFSPAVAGAGNHNVTYSKTQGACTRSITKDIVVYNLPPVEAGVDLEFCNNTDVIQNLNTTLVSPLNGTWASISPSVNAIDQSNNTIDLSRLTPSIDYTLVYEFTDDNGCYNIDTRTVTVNSTLSAPTIQDGNFVCGEGPVLMQVFSPQDSVLYRWFDSETSEVPVFSGLSYQTPYLTEAKSYYLSARNKFGCESDRAEVIADVRSTPSIEFSAEEQTQYTCLEGDIVNLTGSDGYTIFRWSGTGVNSETEEFDPTGLPPGSYRINFRGNINGCEGQGSKNVVIREPGTVEAGFKRQVCFGDEIAVLNNSSVVVPSDGIWSFENPAFSSAISGDTVDLSKIQPDNVGYRMVYSVVDTFGCINSDVVYLAVYADPALPIAENQERCGSGGVLYQIKNTDNGEQYKWYDKLDETKELLYTGRAFPTPVIDSSLSYFVQAVNPNRGCTSDFLEVRTTIHPLPEVSAELNTVLCLNTNSFDMNELVEPKGGTFYDSDGLVVSDRVFPEVIGEGAFLYEYEVRNNNNCFNSEFFQITITGSISDNILIADDTSICKSAAPIYLQDWALIKGGTFTSNLAVENNYLTPSLSNRNVIAINYELDQDGCTFKDQIAVTFLTSPENPSIIGDNEGCEGDILEFSTQNLSNLTYRWYLDNDPVAFSSDQNINVEVGQVDLVELEVINLNDCASPDRAFVEILNGTPQGEISIDMNFIEIGTMVKHQVQTENDLSYIQWSFGDGFTSNNQIANHYYYRTDTLYPSVLLVSDIGCSNLITSADSLIIWSEDQAIPTAAGNLTTSTKNEVVAYPTLASHTIQLKFTKDIPSGLSIEIFDLNGRLINTELLYQPSINITNLKPGNYLLKVSGNNIDTSFFKIIKL